MVVTMRRMRTCSWYEFAVEIFKQAGMDVKVTPVSTAEYTAAYPGQAKRPMNSRISKENFWTTDLSAFRLGRMR